jgi:hypothetical protein
MESPQEMRKLLQKCEEQSGKSDALSFWIGEDLLPFSPSSTHCAVLAISYSVCGVCLGSIALLGPQRLAYRRLSALLQKISAIVGNSLAERIQRHQLTYRRPYQNAPFVQTHERLLIDASGKESGKEGEGKDCQYKKGEKKK